MIVERTDFMSVPVTDMERSTRFYEETLGLHKASGGGFPEFETGNVSLYLIDMTAVGSEFTAPHSAYIALRVADVAQAKRELEERGVTFAGEHDSGVCNMAFFHDSEGNSLMLHRRYAP